MAGFGSVLRGFGSVLNPQVAQEVAQEERAKEAQAQQLGMFALQQQAANNKLAQEQAFAAAENAKKLKASFDMHMAEQRQKAQDKLVQIEEAAKQQRITREEADARTAALRKEMQDREIAGREYMARVVAGMRPAPQPQMVTTPEGVFQVGRDSKAAPVVGPDGKPLSGKPLEKALPTSAAQKLFENQTNLRRAEQALALAEGKNLASGVGDQSATGWKGFLPDAILQRADPEGVDTRAALADLGSLVIHDRSGAAVTAAEFPRLRPFIPQVTDDQETVKKKLKRFSEVYKSIVDDTRDFYKESGYKVPDFKPTTPAAPPKPGKPKEVSFGDLK